MRVQQNAWLVGAYVKNALQSTILTAGLADKQTASKLPKYPEMPKYESQDMTEERKQAERLRLFKYYKKLAKINNKNRG